MKRSVVLLALTLSLLTAVMTGSAASQPTQPAPSGRGEYKLIFPPAYEVPLKPKGPARDASRESKFDNFLERLNQVGSEGYKLISFVYDGTGLPVGLVRKAKAAYEYRWLYSEAIVGGQEVTADFDRAYPELSRQGFRLADYSEFENHCDYFDTSEPGPIPQQCHDAYVFLFEREKGDPRPARHALAALTSASDAGFLTEVKRILADGFVPKHSLPVYKFWFEPAGTRDGRWGGTDVELLSEASEALSWRRSTFKKRVNELGRQGYRAAMLDWGLALMFRARGAVEGYSYVWVKADGALEKRLAQLQAKGAVYRNTYRGEKQLVFEQKAVDDGTRHECKTLKFKLEKTDGARGTRVRVDFASASKGILSALDKLVSEGFAARDLFLSGGRVGVILERSH